MEKTSMQRLKDRLFDVTIQHNPITYDEIESLIELEKKQIIDAYNSGYSNGNIDTTMLGGEYFDKFFNKTNERLFKIGDTIGKIVLEFPYGFVRVELQNGRLITMLESENELTNKQTNIKVKKGTHEAIERRIKLLKKSIEKMKRNLEIVEDEPATQICKHCNTNNSHYYAKSDVWVCAFC